MFLKNSIFFSSKEVSLLPLKFLKSRILATADVGKVEEQWKLSLFAGGNANDHSHLEKQLTISYETVYSYQ